MSTWSGGCLTKVCLSRLQPLRLLIRARARRCRGCSRVRAKRSRWWGGMARTAAVRPMTPNKLGPVLFGPPSLHVWHVAHLCKERTRWRGPWGRERRGCNGCAAQPPRNRGMGTHALCLEDLGTSRSIAVISVRRGHDQGTIKRKAEPVERGVPLVMAPRPRIQKPST